MEKHVDIEKYSRVYAAVHLDAISDNLEAMRANIDDQTLIMPVVKADGYGHGAIPVAKLLEDREGIFGFAVATAEEAFLLKKSRIKKPLLILGFTFPYACPEIVAQEIRPAIFQYETAVIFSEEAKRQNKTVYFHIKVDTGMSRIGFAPTLENAEVIKRISMLPNVEIEGLFTHFARADEKDKKYADLQLKKFLDFCADLKELGVDIKIRHCANSAGIVEIRRSNLDLVRAGISLYGLWPSAEVSREILSLRPALELKSRIIYIKEIEAGTQVSYGGTFLSGKRMRVATIPVGYGDGYPRELSNRGFMLVHGKKAGILGRVCMDQCMIDVTDIEEAEEGDMVTLIGRDEGALLTAEEVSRLSGRFHYELLCGLGKRVPRVYYLNGRVIKSKDYYEDLME